MKKFVFAFTILLSSFFFFNFKVKAVVKEYSFEINFDNINDTFFNIKTSAENYITSSTYDNFIIYTNESNYFRVYFYNLNSSSFKCYTYASFSCLLSPVTVYNYEFRSSSSSFSKLGFTSDPRFNNPNYLLYSSVPIKMDNIRVNFIYDSFNYSISENDNYLPIYDLYLKYQEYLGNKDLVYQEEKEKLESFYILCIDKLNYLSEVFLSNYIYLSIIVIFIIIFVFKLIFRRFL